MTTNEVSSTEAVKIHVLVTVGPGGILALSGPNVARDGAIEIPNGGPGAMCKIIFELANDPISAQFSFQNGVFLTVRDHDNFYSGLLRRVVLDNFQLRASTAYCTLAVFNPTTGTLIRQDPPIRNR